MVLTVPVGGVVLAGTVKEVVALAVVGVGLEEVRVLGIIALLLAELGGDGTVVVLASPCETRGRGGVRTGGDGNESSKYRDNGGKVGEHVDDVDDEEKGLGCWGSRSKVIKTVAGLCSECWVDCKGRLGRQQESKVVESRGRE